ncbi:MAG: DNA-3-methyladenine glycosylase [Chloroflexota bacterium]
MSRLDQSFFARDTVTVARSLLGQVLVHESAEGRAAGRIVEAEAYSGWDDRASHGHRGRTPRNAVMFGPVGFSYVYFIYGRYWMLNVIAKPPGVEYPAAVLLRALEPLSGLELMANRRSGRPQKEWTSGPGRLTLALGIDETHNQLDLTAADSPLYFEDGGSTDSLQISSGPRVGLGTVPEPWKSRPWRFWIADNAYVSRG